MSFKTNYICSICNKSYIRKTYWEQHFQICKIRIQSQREASIQLEESSIMPTQKEIFYMIHSLTLKCDKLEKEVKSLKNAQTTNLRNMKKSVDIPTWLKIQYNPQQNFEDWVNEFETIETPVVSNFMSDTVDIKEIKLANILKLFKELIESQLVLDNKTTYPIACVSINKNTFYIYHDEEWVEASNTNLCIFFKRMNRIILNQCIQYNTQNKHKMKTDDKIVFKYNKFLAVMMDISFQEADIHKLAMPLFQYLKTEFTDVN
jgi:hypothetical protein